MSIRRTPGYRGLSPAVERIVNTPLPYDMEPELKKKAQEDKEISVYGPHSFTHRSKNGTWPVMRKPPLSDMVSGECNLYRR